MTKKKTQTKKQARVRTPMAKTTPWREIRRTLDPDGEARVEIIKQAMRDANTLAQLRDLAGMRQIDVAEALGTNQAGVSRLERRGDLYLSTLRDYIAALGGDLELIAAFPDGSRLRVEPIREAVPVG